LTVVGGASVEVLTSVSLVGPWSESSKFKGKKKKKILMVGNRERENEAFNFEDSNRKDAMMEAIYQKRNK
jgi:hypothetical protein